MKSAVTVSLVNEARGGPFVYWDDFPAACVAASALGFDAVELFAPGPDEISAGELQTILNDSRLNLAAVGTGAGWVIWKLTLTSPDFGIRRRAIDFIKSMIDFGGPHGAPAIIGSMQGRWGDGIDRATALGWLGEAIVELGNHARQYGVPLFYEPLNRYETNLCNTVRQGVELLTSANAANVKLLCDLFHMNIEEVEIGMALQQAGNWLGHIHFVDSNRRPVGCGHLDYRPIMAALREAKYAGYLSAEALPFPDPQTAAEQTIRGYRYWTAL